MTNLQWNRAETLTVTLKFFKCVIICSIVSKALKQNNSVTINFTVGIFKVKIWE